MYATYNLKVLYANGECVEQDYTKVFEYFERSNLRTLYNKGEGVTKDIAKAKEYFDKSAKLGNEIAQKRLQNL